MAIKFTIGEADAQRYGIPRTVTLPDKPLDGVPGKQIDEWESALPTGETIVTAMGYWYPRRSGWAIRYMVWLTCKVTKVEVPDFDEFDIAPFSVADEVLKTKRGKAPAADADPLEPSATSTEASPSESA